MSTGRGIAVGIGALAGGGIGFWLQNKYIDKSKAENEEYIEREARQRVQEAAVPRPVATAENDRADVK